MRNLKKAGRANYHEEGLRGLLSAQKDREGRVPAAYCRTKIVISASGAKAHATTTVALDLGPRSRREKVTTGSATP